MKNSFSYLKKGCTRKHCSGNIVCFVKPIFEGASQYMEQESQTKSIDIDSNTFNTSQAQLQHNIQSICMQNIITLIFAYTLESLHTSNLVESSCTTYVCVCVYVHRGEDVPDVEQEWIMCVCKS